MWIWCDQVVTWLNHEFAWRGAAAVPACWPQHPYFAHEIALLACQRYAAGEYEGPELLEEWTRNTFPMFAERLTTRTGEGCRKEHTDWPAAPAFHRHVDKAVATARLDLFGEDTNQPPLDQRGTA